MAITSNQSVVLMDASGRSVEYARLQMRRGLESQFDASKMLPAEFAVTTDTKKAYLAFAAGDVKRLSTYEDMTQDLADALAKIEQEYLDQISTATSKAQAATSAANTATQSANTATANANAAADEARKTTWNNKNLTNSTSASESQVETAAGAAVLTGVDGKTLQDGTPTPDVPIPVQGVGGKTGDESFGFNVVIHSHQLFDYKKLEGKTSGDVTVTNNNDGSFTILGSGVSPGSGMPRYDMSKEESLQLLKIGTLRFSGESNVRPKFMAGIRNAKSGMFSKNVGNTTNKSFEITEEDIENIKNGIDVFSFCFYDNSGVQIVSGTIKPMVYMDGDGTWQPYHRSELPITLAQPLFDGNKIMQVKAGQTYVDADGAIQTADKDIFGIYKTWNSEKISVDMSDATETSVGTFRKFFPISKEFDYKNYSDRNDGSYCSHFKYKRSANSEDECYYVGTSTNYKSVTFTTLSKTFSKDVWVVYKLKTPYFDPFADQEPFFKWTTPTGGCTITTDDPLEPIISADTAQTPEGSYLLTGYIDGLRGRTLEQRILELEKKAIQEM